MRRRRGVAAASLPALVGLALALGGCGLDTGTTCLDWGVYDTPGEAAEGATVVVRASVVRDDGTERLWGVRANRWVIEVDEVISGDMADVAAGEELTVVSTPRTCTAGNELYPAGDPLDTEDEVIVLVEDDTRFDVVRTLTPYDGVVEPGPDGGLPQIWPHGQHVF
ncbi:hypothetical protein [Antribacter gilvus]|uniref:hypothetical protein n=1 Tax=Antribacter gilvus TaxID=2304675 RepID=UPI000F76DB10|nr:hypothetical protein [Antribacter gilvus]